MVIMTKKDLAAILLIAGIVVCIVPVSAITTWTISPGDSIQAAVNNAANGDTIVLNPGTYSEHDIVVTKNIGIEANTEAGGNSANTVIDAKGLGRIFAVGPYQLTIAHLTLRNGRAADGVTGSEGHWFTDGGTGGAGQNGGAILSGGPVVVTGSVITGSSAGNGGSGGESGWLSTGGTGGSGGSGGAIYTPGSIDLTDSTISDCSAGNGGKGGNKYSTGYSGSGGPGGSGGAVFSGSVVRGTASFIRCRAGDGGIAGDDSGGDGHHGGTGGHGGAVFSAGTVLLDSRTVISSCRAGNGGTANEGGAGGHGGAVYSGGATTVRSSVIQSCNAGDGANDRDLHMHVPSRIEGGHGGSGGAIFSGSTVTLESLRIESCRAGNAGIGSGNGGNGGSGGAVYTAAGGTLTSTVIVSSHSGSYGDGIYYNDGAPGHGGAVYVAGGTMTVDASTFSDSRTDAGGGAIYGYQATTSVAGSTFSNCSAGWGGGIYTFAGKASITGSTFTGCSATYGPAVNGYATAIELHFSRIWQCGSGVVVNNAEGRGVINATYNWWGSNSNPSGKVYATTSSPWLVLGITAEPATIAIDGTSIVRGDLFHTSDGKRISSMTVPDGIPVAFAASSGSVNPSSRTTRGIAATRFTPEGPGIATVSATVDGQTVSATIVSLAPVPGQTMIPTDPDGDGIYEDLNGNSRLDFADVVLYFNQMTWIAANEPIAAFDLNGNGRIDFADIVGLFNEI